MAPWRRAAGAAAAAAAAAGLAAWAGGAGAALAEAPPAAPAAPAGAGAERLLLVQVVFRHGARTPLGKKYWPHLLGEAGAWDVCGAAPPFSLAPLDVREEGGGPRPRNAHDAEQVAARLPGGACHRGELTREGYAQALALGEWLRRRYVDGARFLPEAYDPSDNAVGARSTNYARTLATIAGVWTGLYPELAAAAAGAPPLRVAVTEQMDEILYGDASACAALGARVRQLAAAHSAAPPDAAAEALSEQVRPALAVPRGERVNFLDLHDALTTLRTHGKPLPAALTRPEVLRGVELEATKHFLTFLAPPRETGQQEAVLRLGMGRLLLLLLQRMEAAALSGGGDAQAQQETQKKLYLYSGHDSSVLPLLAALSGGAGVQDWPPYCAHLVFELFEPAGSGAGAGSAPSGSASSARVRVLYRGEPLPLDALCGAPTCSLAALRAALAGPYLVDKARHAEECALHFSHDKPAGRHVRELKVGSSVEADEED
jgi:lysophosphatidic acid phosphatase type 6